MQRSISWLAIIVFLSVSGCASRPAESPRASRTDDSQDAEALAQAVWKSAKPAHGYRIAPGDLVDITVYGESELTSKRRVGQDGGISMPLIGAVKVAGLTVPKAEALLTSQLKPYYLEPQVSLFIEDSGEKKVFVLGEVQKPGAYPIPAETSMTVLEAISSAGGFTPIAGLDRTRILRNVGGKGQVIPVKVTAITQQGQKQDDLELQPNDVVYVPQSYF